jgi:subtilisin-like proprotein convertase family protein
MRQLACLALSACLAACGQPGGELRAAREAVREDGRSLVRLYGPNAFKLRQLVEKRGADVTGSNRQAGFVEVLATRAELDGLQAELAERITHLREERGPDTRALADYHDPAEIAARLAQIEAAHPAIARRVLLRDDLPEGHALWAMKISDQVEVDEDEPTFLMDGQMHAREVMTAEVMLDAIEQLTSRYATDPEVRRWVDGLEIWIVPQLNPDGAAYVFQADPWWRKNRAPACGGARGVDLNRNFAWNWRACPGSDTDCSSDVYHGPLAASEPETRAAQDLMAALRPLYYVNYHSYGEYILWPTGCGPTEEDELLASVGRALNDLVPGDSGQTGGWAIGTPPDVLYSAPGGADDHAYGAVGALGFVFELNTTGFQPEHAVWRDLTVTRQRLGWSHLLSQTLDGPAIHGRVRDQVTLQPVVATWLFANRPFASGQRPLETDAAGRFGRPVLPGSQHLVVFTAPGYLPAAHEVSVGRGPTFLEVRLEAGVNHPPQAAVGPDQVVDEGRTVFLDASASSDPDGNALLFEWAQRTGPAVSLREAHTARPSFFAPSVQADTELEFEVVASDGELASAPATTRVIVRDRWNEISTFPSADTPLAIPDNHPAGIQSVIFVDVDRPILRAVAHVDIQHTWIGDLWIGLESPAGTRLTLHDHAGGSTHDLHADFELTRVVGERSGGDWTLEIRDEGPSDVGTLQGWSLRLELVGDEACEPGWEDCNQDLFDGCETPLGTDLDCAACGDACLDRFPNALSACQAGACALTACLPGFADCDQDPFDGCETPLGTDLDCAACGDACLDRFPNALSACQAGACALTACLPGFADCDQDPFDGCETPLGTDLDCAACGDACLDGGHCEAGRCPPPPDPDERLGGGGGCSSPGQTGGSGWAWLLLVGWLWRREAR